MWSALKDYFLHYDLIISLGKSISSYCIDQILINFMNTIKRFLELRLGFVSNLPDYQRLKIEHNFYDAIKDLHISMDRWNYRFIRALIKVGIFKADRKIKDPKN